MIEQHVDDREHHRLIRDQRKWAKANSARVKAEWDALPQQETIAEFRARIGEELWQELNRAWQ